MHRMQTKTTIQISTLFILPVLLLYFGIIPIAYRFFVLLVITVMTTTIIVVEKWTWKDLGIRFDNIKKNILLYFILTVTTIVVIVLLATLLGNKHQPIWENVHFQYGFIIVSFLQEFLFRSFLIPKLKEITISPAFVIPVNAFLFGLIHIIFPGALLTFLLTSLLGLGFAWVYYFQPNLILATITHSIINFVAVYYCFASLNSAC